MKILIVNYHYLRERKTGKGIHPITTSEFIYQLDLLEKKYKFLSQSKLISLLSNSKESLPEEDFCLLTFDDGLKEQLKAFDILKKKKIPGIFFISTMPLVERRACLVHKFHYVMEQIKFESLYHSILKIFPDSIEKFNDPEFLKSASLKYIYDKPNWAKVKLYVNFSLTRENKTLLVDQLFDTLKIDEGGFVENLYMDNQDIIQIAHEGMLGSHCVTHNPLGEMSALEINTELSDSKSYLSNITGEAIPSVSYPYGDKKAVTQSVLDISHKYYDLGITTQGGINQNNDLMNKKLSLNRVSEAEIAKGNYI